MQLVKILGPEYSIKTLEEGINQWLKNNAYKKIVDIKVVGEAAGNRFCAMIIYELGFTEKSVQ